MAAAEAADEPGTWKSVEGLIVDISGGGIGLLTPQEVPAGIQSRLLEALERKMRAKGCGDVKKADA